MTFRFRASVGLLVGLVLLAGCGGSENGQALSEQEYETAVYELAHGELAGEAQQLFVQVVAFPLSPDQCSEQARRFHDVLAQIVDRLEEITPPAEIRDLHHDFILEAHESVGEVGRAADDVRDGRLSCGMDLNRRVYGLASTQRAEEVISEAQRRGYLPYLYGQ
jgi:hypothetical protein